MDQGIAVWRPSSIIHIVDFEQDGRALTSASPGVTVTETTPPRR
jgi:hypothetical protein